MDASRRQAPRELADIRLHLHVQSLGIKKGDDSRRSPVFRRSSQARVIILTMLAGNDGGVMVESLYFDFIFFFNNNIGIVSLAH
jgi:hypothetical protein